MSLDFTIPELHIGNAGTPPIQFYKQGLKIGGSGSSPSWQDIILSGNGSLSLTNAKANGLNYLKLFGGTEQRNLPNGYTEYEYLRSSGTQYIDLGYKGKGNTKAEIKFRYYQTSSATGSGRVFGSRQTSSSNAFAIGTSSGIVSSTGNEVFWCYDGQSFYVVEDAPFGLDEWQTVVFSATEHKVNGTTEGDDYTVTTFETPSNLKLFAFDNNGTIGCGYVDIAYCKLWDDDGTLVRNVVPSGDGTTYSMYDKVSGTMLPNAGTGDFIAGAVATPTPDMPMNIVSNNGVIKYSLNMANVNAQTTLIGYYISSSGVVTADANNWMYQDFIPVKPNTTYTLTMSAPVYFVTISEYSTADDSGFIRRNAGSSGDNTTLTIITGSTTNFVRFGTNIDRTEVTLDRVLAINWMLNEGNSKVYQPYVEGGIYTDGTVETVEVTGKNLFDKDSTPYQTGAYINSATVGASTFQMSAHSNYNIYRIDIQPNTTYTFGIIKANAPYWVVTDGSVILDCSANNGGTEGTNITITTPANAKYLYLSVGINGTYKCDDILQLELGSTATEYEPYYYGGTATAEMLLKVGDYQDVQSVLDGNVTRNIGIEVLDGTENWTFSNAFYRGFSGKTTNKADTIISTHFNFSRATSSAAPDFSVVGYMSTNIGFKYSALNGDINAWKQWLADQYANGTPVIVVYPLAEPTTESVTAQPLTIQAGSNDVVITQASMDNLQLEVSYKGTV